MLERSETMAGIFDDLAEQGGLSALQIRYPLGISETDFLDGMREAKRLRIRTRPFQDN